jgi:hypothetical protein
MVLVLFLFALCRPTTIRLNCLFGRSYRASEYRAKNENMMRESVFFESFLHTLISVARSYKNADLIAVLRLLFSEISCGQFVKQHNRVRFDVS